MFVFIRDNTFKGCPECRAEGVAITDADEEAKVIMG